jgi:hypothetical protein
LDHAAHLISHLPVSAARAYEGDVRDALHRAVGVYKSEAHIALNVLADIAYAPYYLAYEYNKHTQPDHSGIHKLLVLVQKGSLSADAAVDYLKRVTGVAPGEGRYDEPPPGVPVGIFPVHVPYIEPRLRLPGYWVDSRGRYHRDIAP